MDLGRATDGIGHLMILKIISLYNSIDFLYFSHSVPHATSEPGD